MNIEDFEEALTDLIGDNFQIDVDNDGQLIIYTGLKEDEDGELVEYVSDEDMEEDPDIDGDTEPLDLEDDEE